MSKHYKIVVCGEGGQGVLSIAKIIATAAWLQGRKAIYLPNFTTEKRGGVSMAFAQIGDEPIRFPRFEKADLCVALSQRALERLLPFFKDGTVVIVNSMLVKDLSGIEQWKPYRVDATTIAKEQLKKPRTFNMVIMGAMLKCIPGLSVEGFDGALKKQFDSKYKKDPTLKDLNEKAFRIGYELIS